MKVGTKLDAQVLSHLDDAERLASAFQNASDSLKEEGHHPRCRCHAAHHALPAGRRQRPGTRPADSGSGVRR